MMKHAAAVCLALFLPLVLSPVSARGEEDESPITLDEFLASVRRDFHILHHQEIMNYLETTKASTPVLNKIEVRYETEDMTGQDHRYALRFYPKGWGETRSAARETRTIKETNQTRHDALLNEAIKQRYDMVLDYLEIREHLRLSKELLLVHEDTSEIFSRLRSNGHAVDIEAMVEAEDALIDTQLEIVKIENQLAQTESSIRFTLNQRSAIAFSPDTIISPSHVADRLASLEIPAGNPTNPHLHEQFMQIRLAESRYLLERAKERDFISFLHLQYTSKDVEEPEKAVSVGAALKLPFINPDREELHRRKIKYLEEKLLFQLEQKDLCEKIESLTQSLKRFIRQREIIVNRQSAGNTELSYTRYLSMEGIDPLKLLQVKESIMNGKITLNQLNFLILRRYLDLLDKLGILGRAPLLNHLSPTQAALP